MSGLDPAATEEILRILVKQAGHDGSTVLFSSHQLADVEQIADHIAIVDRGRVVIDGTLDDVRASYRRIQLVFGTPRPITFSSLAVSSTCGATAECCRCCRAAERRASSPRARSLSPVSVDVHPVTLKEIFLEAVSVEN